MTALPTHPTERDRERFRDITKAMGFALEYNRNDRLVVYRDATTEMAWKIWWAQERERQLLQNLNMSQGCKLSELGAELTKLKENIEDLRLENGFIHMHKIDDAESWKERAERAEAILSSPTSIHVAMLRGEVPMPTWRQHAHLTGAVPNTEEDQLAEIVRLREEVKRLEKSESELEAERKRLDWALKKQAYYARNPDRLWVDVGTGNHKWFAVNNDNPRATIDELIAGEKK